MGASTGGFTDCMLQHGAQKVYSIDVGYGQLDWRLRADERVIVLEKTNVRYMTEEQVPELVDFASIDVSFISLTKIIDAVKSRLREEAEVVCLIKPQFEAGKEKVGKNGVVRDKEVHCEVISFVVGEMMKRGFQILGLDFSPIKGPAGNIEYLLHIKNQTDRREAEGERDEKDGMWVEKETRKKYGEIEMVVRKSHEMVV